NEHPDGCFFVSTYRSRSRQQYSLLFFPAASQARWIPVTLILTFSYHDDVRCAIASPYGAEMAHDAKHGK
ncbi:TPA: hypothetical protein ACQJXC_002053, partial [Raoultella ornithinolytica]